MTDGGVGIHATTPTVMGNNPIALCSGLAGSLGIANPTASGALLQLLASKWYARGRGRSREELDADDLTDAPGIASEEPEDTSFSAISQKPPVASLVEELENGGAVAGMDERAYVNTSLSDVSQPLTTVSEGGINTNNLYLFDRGETDFTSMLEPVTSESSPEINLMAGISELEDDSAQFAFEPQGLPSTDAGIFSALPLAEGESTYGFDGRGSVTAAFDVKGELLGSVAFGIAGTIEASFGELPSRGWNAEEADVTTGLVYLRARFLMSGTLSFASQDTYLGQVTNPASQNRYAFAEGDPVNAIDPTGHRDFTTYELRYMNEAYRRNQELLAVRENPALKSQIYERRRQYNAANPLRTSSQRQTNEQLLATMSAGQDPSYLAWSMYNNGWISKAAAEKYCSQYLHMGKEAPKPMALSQCATALDALQKGASFTIDITKAANAAGWQAGKVVVKSGAKYGQGSLAAMNSALSGIGEVVGAVGFVTGAGCVAIDTYSAYNNPNVTPDRAASDAFVEFQVGSGVLVIGTAGGLLASAGAYALVGSLFGGPAGFVAGALAGLAFGIGTLLVNRYLEDSGKKQQMKDDYYAVRYSNRK